MKKLGEKIGFLLVFTQAVAVGGIYMYCKRERWNLEESLTAFIYPLFSIALIGLVILSILFLVFYFIGKLNHVKKVYYGIPALVVIGMVLWTNHYFSEARLREYNFEGYLEQREEIVRGILDGELVVKESVIDLPSELADEEMARGGRVYVVRVGNQSGIYFCTFSGLMESSAGFVYLTEQEFDEYLQNQVVLQEEYGDGWYYCGTN